MTAMSAVILRDDRKCKSKLSNFVGPLAGGVVFGVTVLIITAVLVAFKMGWLSQSSYLMLTKNEGDQSPL